MQGWEKLPEKFKRNVEDLHTMNPEYTHMQWDEESLREACQSISEECLARYNSFEFMISRVDFGRYVVLYLYGGGYFDVDMKPLNSLRTTPGLDTSTFIISEDTYPQNLLGGINNAIIFCTPKNSVMKKIVDHVISDSRTSADFSMKETYVVNTTGPTMIQAQIKEHKNEVTVLPYKYYEPCNTLNAYCKPDKDSIMDHRHEGSWITGSVYDIYSFLGRTCYFLIHYIWYVLFGLVVLVVAIWNRKSLYKMLSAKGGRKEKRSV